MSRTLERFAVIFLAFIGYTIADILAGPIWAKDITLYVHWFAAWQVALATLGIVIGIAYRSVLLPVSLLVLAWNGAEDFFYYLLQMKLPPESLPWLTSPLVIQPASNLSTMIGVAWGFALLIFLSRTRIRV